MGFKKLEITPTGNWFKRNIWTSHGKKTIVYVVLGSLISLAFHAITREGDWFAMTSGEMTSSLFMGALFGLFLTNSPCARGRC